MKKMNKIISVVLAMLMACSCFVFVASAEEAMVDSAAVEETVSAVISSEEGSVCPWGRITVVCR